MVGTVLKECCLFQWSNNGQELLLLYSAVGEK